MDIYWQRGLYALQSGRGLLTVVNAKRCFCNFFIDLIVFAVHYVPIGMGAVQLSNNGRVRIGSG